MRQDSIDTQQDQTTAPAETEAQAPAETGAQAPAETGAQAPAETEAQTPAGTGASVSDDLDPSRLDDLPENKRRARVLVASIVVLFVAAIATLVSMPPLSWSPQKNVSSTYNAVATVTQSTASQAASARVLTYAMITDEVVYKLHMHQVSYYANDAEATFDLTADVRVSRPKRRQFDDEIALKLDHVQVNLDTPDAKVDLADAGTQLQGIYMYSRLNPSQGMYSIVPDANINPHVARVLFSVSDAMRQVWPPLPSEPQAQGSSWSFEDQTPDAAKVRRLGTAKLERLDANGAHVQTQVALSSLPARTPLGSATLHTELSKEGRVAQAKVHFERTEPSFEGSAVRQITDLSLATVGD